MFFRDFTVFKLKCAKENALLFQNAEESESNLITFKEDLTAKVSREFLKNR